MYVVTGATGNTGSVVANSLLEKGKKVRLVGRDIQKLERFKQAGAEPFRADVTDEGAMAKALAGADAAYLMIPPNPGAPDVIGYFRQVEAAAGAAQSSGLRYAVVLSSVGADKPDKTGPVVGLHRLEEKFDKIPGLNALYLRAGYFMENLLPQIGVIQSMGFMAGPLKEDLKLPFIATRDIGNAAADALVGLKFQGKARRELQGQRDISYAEVAKIIGKAIGKPDLVYKQVPGAMLKPALMQMGMSGSMVELLLDMAEALNTGYMRALEPRSAENTTATSIEEFVRDVFVPAYRGKSASA